MSISPSSSTEDIHTAAGSNVTMDESTSGKSTDLLPYLEQIKGTPKAKALLLQLEQLQEKQKSKRSPKAKSLLTGLRSLTPNFATHKKTFPYILDATKQVKRLRRRMLNHNVFHPGNFELSATGVSAKLENNNPILFKTFVSVLERLFGKDSLLRPKCSTHNLVPLSFTSSTDYDSNVPPASVRLQVTAYQWVGNNREKQGSIIAHYTTQNIQVQGTAEQVQFWLRMLIPPLMEITLAVHKNTVDIHSIQCMDCTVHHMNTGMEVTPHTPSKQLSITNEPANAPNTNTAISHTSSQLSITNDLENVTDADVGTPSETVTTNQLCITHEPEKPIITNELANDPNTNTATPHVSPRQLSITNGPENVPDANTATPSVTVNQPCVAHETENPITTHNAPPNATTTPLPLPFISNLDAAANINALLTSPAVSDCTSLTEDNNEQLAGDSTAVAPTPQVVNPDTLPPETSSPPSSPLQPITPVVHLPPTPATPVSHKVTKASLLPLSPVQKHLFPNTTMSPTITPNQQILEFNRLVSRVGDIEQQAINTSKEINRLNNLRIADAKRIDNLETKNAELTRKCEKNQSERVELQKIIIAHNDDRKKMEQLIEENADAHSKCDLLAKALHSQAVAFSTKIKALEKLVTPEVKPQEHAPQPIISDVQQQQTNPTSPTTASNSSPTPRQMPTNEPPPVNTTVPPPSTSMTAPHVNRRTKPQTSQQPPPNPDRLHHQPRIQIYGASNLGKIAPALKNTIPDINIKSVPGATFEHMIGEMAMGPSSDIIILSGGVNEAAALDEADLARQAVRDAIATAKHKANRVIVMPPPPLKDARVALNIQKITSIITQEAQQAGVECVKVSSEYQDPRVENSFLFSRDGLHVTKLGGGLYVHALLRHLESNHSDVKLISPLCVGCYHTGHKVDSCADTKSKINKSQGSSPPRNRPVRNQNRQRTQGRTHIRPLMQQPQPTDFRQHSNYYLPRVNTYVNPIRDYYHPAQAMTYGPPPFGHFTPGSGW